MDDDGSLVGMITSFLLAGIVMDNLNLPFWWMVRDVPMVVFILFVGWVVWVGTSTAVDRLFKYGVLVDG